MELGGDPGDPGDPGVKHEKLDEFAYEISDERLDDAAELGQDIVDDSDENEQVTVGSETWFPNSNLCVPYSKRVCVMLPLIITDF